MLSARSVGSPLLPGAVVWPLTFCLKIMCPTEVKEALTEILYQSFLGIRMHCDDRDICFALSDHAHNLPHLLSGFTIEMFKFYWEISRPSFLREIAGMRNSFNHRFDAHWAVLEGYYNTLGDESS